MAATEFQTRIKPLLEQHYPQVLLEWPVYKNATDPFQRNISQYYPRTDIAVGPFSIDHGHNTDINLNLVNPALERKLRLLHRHNPNPRCLLAIEVVFSGSSKHILGDILNASAIGLYGIVVGTPEMLPKIKRNMEYLKKLAEVGKLSPLPFQNVLIMDTTEFEMSLN